MVSGVSHSPPIPGAKCARVNHPCVCVLLQGQNGKGHFLDF